METSFLLGIMIAAWVYVIYRLISGSKIKVETLKGKYNLVSIVLVIGAFIFLLIKRFSLINLIFALGIVLAYIMYTCIPSGYNEEAIYIKGKKCPYNKIDEVKKEYVDDVYRLNFRYKFRYYFIDAKEGNEKIINDCEQLYKKGK